MNDQNLCLVESVVTKRSNKKLSSLLKNVKSSPCIFEFPSNPERYVHNLSSITLDKHLLEVLSLGPKFYCPRNIPKQLDLEVQFENLYAQLGDMQSSSALELEHFKSTLVNSCYQYLNSKVVCKQLLTTKHLECLESLKKNSNILITKPDKGNGIVLLNKSDYLEKMNCILKDESKFQKAEKEKDKTIQIEKALWKLLRNLKQNDLIDSTTFERIRPTGTMIPRLYGLPKVHKQNVPLRPILDMCNSPYHATARWLATILEPIRRELVHHSLNDSFDFVKAVDGLHINQSKMFSLDVSSLFTNVPLRETIDFICDHIRMNSIDICIPPDDLQQLLLFCTYNIQFKFNGEIYRQKDGVAMGSPLGPLLADIFMASLENNKLHQFINHFILYKR